MMTMTRQRVCAPAVDIPTDDELRRWAGIDTGYDSPYAHVSTGRKRETWSDYSGDYLDEWN